MKIKNITDTKKFFEIICHCKGDVVLITSHGDRINLKSSICQYLELTEMFADSRIDEVEIIASNPDDIQLVMEFLVTA